jgi:hypothetical protein
MEDGMYLRDACKIVKEYGDPSEYTIGGNTEQPRCAEELEKKLTDEVYKEALNYRVQSYAKCKGANALKHALMNYGPVLGSVKWYDDFKLKDKVIAFDKNTDYGYHAIVVCGWNEKGWICQNSWGRSWNSDGKFIYPFEEEFTELWSFVDAANEDVIIPKRNHWTNYIYKFFNYIINIIKRWLP